MITHEMKVTSVAAELEIHMLGHVFDVCILCHVLLTRRWWHVLFTFTRTGGMFCSRF